MVFRFSVMRPRAALTVDFLKSRRSGLLPALGNELLWFLRRLSWPCGAGRPYGAHIPKSALPVALRGGGPSGGAADSLIAAAVHHARSGRRCEGRRCAACRRVP